MGNIITLATAKGGAGKTSATIVISAWLARNSYKVAVVDADPNRSFARWHQEAYEGPALTCTTEAMPAKVVSHVQAQAETHDLVLVDTAGFGNVTAAHAAATADFVIVPIMPDRTSVALALETLEQVESLAKASRRAIPCRVLKSRWNPRGLVERAILDDLQQAGAPTLVQHLSDLAEFGKLSLTGAVPTVGKLGSQVGKIVDELVAADVIPAKPSRKGAAA